VYPEAAGAKWIPLIYIQYIDCSGDSQALHDQTRDPARIDEWPPMPDPHRRTRVVKRLSPGQTGTARHVRSYGDALVWVR
jgi:hypothetical protein